VGALEAARLGVKWDRVQASGIGVPEESVRRLEELWHRHLVRHGRHRPAPIPEEVPSPARFVEGAVRRVFVNAYERSPTARRACIAHHGTDCAACGFNFVQVYGPMGEGFIHVHHLRDLATIGEEYEVDPVADLRPVCPNCHAMLHTRTPAMSVEELRRIVEANRSKARQELHRL
jgi:hypothetical protein